MTDNAALELCPWHDDAHDESEPFLETVELPGAVSALHRVRCHDCGATGPNCSTKRQARAAWNQCASRPAPAEVERYRHVKRGTEYTVIGEGELQVATCLALGDGARIIIYRGEDGKLWAREEGEFHDGRFAALRGQGEA